MRLCIAARIDRSVCPARRVIEIFQSGLHDNAAINAALSGQHTRKRRASGDGLFAPTTLVSIILWIVFLRSLALSRLRLSIYWCTLHLLGYL